MTLGDFIGMIKLIFEVIVAFFSKKDKDEEEGNK